MSLALIAKLEEQGSISLTGLRLPADITREQFEALGAMLGRLHETLRFAIGDYILEGEKLWGQEAYDLVEALGISEESRRQYVRVAQAIPLPRRRAELTWSHHRSVAALEPAAQDEWLEQAHQHGWTRAELDAHLHPTPEIEPHLVVEQVIETAKVVYQCAIRGDGCYLVDTGHMENLGIALMLREP